MKMTLYFVFILILMLLKYNCFYGFFLTILTPSDQREEKEQKTLLTGQRKKKSGSSEVFKQQFQELQIRIPLAHSQIL